MNIYETELQNLAPSFNGNDATTWDSNRIGNSATKRVSRIASDSLLCMVCQPVAHKRQDAHWFFSHSCFGDLSLCWHLFAASRFR